MCVWGAPSHRASWTHPDLRGWLENRSSRSTEVIKNAVKDIQSLVWSLAADWCYWGCACMEGDWISACLCWRRTWRAWKVLWLCLSKEKYRFSCPADLSCSFTSVDFVIFFGGFLEFRRFHCRVFGFTIRKHQTYLSLACLPVFLQLKTFSDSTAVALVVSVRIFCLQNISAFSCCSHAGRFCDRLWIW